MLGGLDKELGVFNRRVGEDAVAEIENVADAAERGEEFVG